LTSNSTATPVSTVLPNSSRTLAVTQCCSPARFWAASDDEWETIAAACRDNDASLLYWAAYECVLFDGRPIRQPAALDDMRERTVTVGAASLAESS
jgi:hypothetical protein